MAFEVEVKYPLVDEAGLRARLLALPARFVGQIDQEDEYLNHPCRDFATTDEALRIRRSGTENRITFKGPLLDSETKSREEFEVPFQDGAQAAVQMREVFLKLGFQSVFYVRKRREVFELTFAGRHFEIMIDDVAGLGKYVELECTADEQTREQARIDLLQLASSLNLGPEMERRSYLRLLLARA